MPSPRRSSSISSLDSALTSLQPLLPPAPPRFPTLSELLQSPDVSRESSPDPGLFVSLVNNPAAMFDDLLRSPGKYEEGVSELLQELISGHRQLGELQAEERALLDRATLDLNRPAPPPRPESKTSSSSSAEKEKTPEVMHPEVEEEGTVPEDLELEEELVPAWFR